MRGFAGEDADAISAILDETYGHDPRLRALHSGGHGPPREQPFRRTSIAEVHEEVVAAGTISHRSSRPLHTWVDLVVAPAFRRRGIGSAVLNDLRAIAPAPLWARVRYDQPGGAPFFLRHGFGLINRSWEGRFDPKRVLPRLSDPRLYGTPTREEAAAFFERWYRHVHEWDPPEPMPLERALELFCGDDMIPGSLVGLREHGRLSGAANLIRPPAFDPGDELYLVWIGALGTRHAPATTLLGAGIRLAHEAGKAIRFEVDESNIPVHEALGHLGLLDGPTLAFYAEPGRP